jgi:hypothetical protein
VGSRGGTRPTPSFARSNGQVHGPLGDRDERPCSPPRTQPNRLFRVKRATCFPRLRPAGTGGYMRSVFDGVG